MSAFSTTVTLLEDDMEHSLSHHILWIEPTAEKVGSQMKNHLTHHSSTHAWLILCSISEGSLVQIQWGYIHCTRCVAKPHPECVASPESQEAVAIM